MAATPNWSAARSGLLGDTGAVDASAQINQFFGTHPMTMVYRGNQILTPFGSGGTAWAYQLSTQDISQPFTMSGTSIGRVVVPLLAVGNGADLIVSLCSNNAGVPGSVITQTRIPATWINSLSAVTSASAPSSSPPITQYTNSPLATAALNGLHLGAMSTVSWPLPAVQTTGSLVYPGAATIGNYVVLVGGTNIVGGTTLFNNVFTITGDSEGTLAQAVPQAPFPTVVANPALVGVTDPTSGAVVIVAVSGQTAHGADPVTAVYSASLNTATGVVGSWTAQPAYPTGVLFPGVAAYNGYLYVLGGQTTVAGATTAAVYFAQVVNGQIQAWTATAQLPVATAQTTSIQAIAIDGFVFVDYYDTGFVRRALYAPINANGSLGTWQPMATVPDNTTPNMFDLTLNADGYGVVLDATDKIVLTGFGVNGPASSWQTANVNTGSAYFNGSWRLLVGGSGSWQYYAGGIGTTGTPGSYMTGTLSLTPMISVPLPTTGLSNGATYHVLIQQAGGDLNDYVRLHDDVNVFPGNPTVLTRAKGSTTWTAGTSGHAVPIQIFDQTAGGQPWHLWSDNGARINTFVWATTPDQRPLGLLDAVQQPGPVLNQWPTFAQGLGPWNVFGGSAATSNAFTHGGLPLSAKITPTGSASLSYIEGDKVAAAPGHSFLVSAWMYSPTGYNNIAVSVNWFDSSKSYLSSTTASNITIPAGTWTLIQGTVTNNVANAVYADVVCIEGGTPPATAIFYVSSATIQDTSGPQMSTVSEMLYGGTWPSTSMWPALGVSKLASAGGASWLAANPGQPALAGQVNQFLSNHDARYIYAGSQQAAQTTGSAVYSTTSGQYLAQKFTTGGAQTTVGQVLLQVSAVGGSPVAPTIPALTLSLYSDNSGTPGTQLGSVVMGEEFIYSSSFWVTFPLAVSGLTPSTNYWLVTSPVGTSSNYYAIQHSNQVSGASISTNGSTWTAQSFGLMYQVFTIGSTGLIQFIYEDSGAAWAQFTYDATGRISALTECVAGQGGTALMSTRTLIYTNGLLTGVS